MTQEEMKKEFSALYEMMARSEKVEFMHTFGMVHKEMMDWFIVNKPELAQEWLDKLESIRWKNYLTPKEAEKRGNKQWRKKALSWKKSLATIAVPYGLQ